MKLSASAAPPCQWFDPCPSDRSREQECRAPAWHKVKVIGGVARAKVRLCEEHKTPVNHEFARRRAAGVVAA